MYRKVLVKPLSVNKAWQGKRYKTPAYKAYCDLLAFILPKMTIDKGKLKLTLKIGFSSKLADIDNPVKLFIDQLQKKYNFNDRDIYELHVYKFIVPKGKEYIEFDISKT